MIHPFKPELVKRLELFVQLEGGGGGGSGGGSTYPIFTITPSTFNFGQVVVGGGQLAVINVTIKNVGTAPLTITNVSITGSGAAAYSTTFGAVPRSIAAGGSYTFSIKFAPTLAQAYNATITFTDNAAGGTQSYALTGTGISTANAIQLDQVVYTFPDIKINATSPMQATLKNVGGGTVSVTSVVCTLPWVLSGLPAFPKSLTPGQSFTFTITFEPTQPANPAQGNVVATATGTGGYSSLLQGNAVVIFPVSILPVNQRVMMLGFANNLKYILTPINYNTDQPTTLLFNGTIFKKPAQEKTILRVWMAYENLGVCTLTLSLSVWRPQLNNGQGAWDVKSAPVTFGNASADGEERSMYFDVETEGEIIKLQLSRAGNAGPVSIISVIPQFVAAGEKVEAV